jgi:hypothetical protein
VPIALADRVLKITRALDEGQDATLADSLVTGNAQVISLLEANDVAIAVDALTTAIQLKLAAISRESKKRSKADNTQIDQWRSEIEALERVVLRLEPR